MMPTQIAGTVNRCDGYAAPLYKIFETFAAQLKNFIEARRPIEAEFNMNLSNHYFDITALGATLRFDVTVAISAEESAVGLIRVTLLSSQMDLRPHREIGNVQFDRSELAINLEAFPDTSAPTYISEPRTAYLIFCMFIYDALKAPIPVRAENHTL